VITTKHGKLGTILAMGSKRLTVCASVWPPVTGTPHAAGAAVAADLGTITRSDGTTQVTYKGHPLYTYAKDGDGGDAYGQGLKSFGASWYVLKPTGSKVDTS
jgi:predicted lipoprotein with Yx(FWY)xxD motif